MVLDMRPMETKTFDVCRLVGCYLSANKLQDNLLYASLYRRENVARFQFVQECFKCHIDVLGEPEPDSELYV